MLTGLNREMGEVKTSVKGIEKRLDRKDRWNVGIVVALVAAVGAWFK